MIARLKTIIYQRKVKRLKRKIAGVKAKLDCIARCKWRSGQTPSNMPMEYFDLILDLECRKAELEEELNQLVNG